VWLCALVLAGVPLATAEWYWRTHGYAPGLIDSRLLWSVQRDRVADRGGDGVALALVGTSHMQYSVDPERLRERLPRYRPVMLAISGKQPVAVLRDLAGDPGFRGIALVDVDADGLRKVAWEDQEPYVRYYHDGWTPSWKLHRLALNRWQTTAVIANPDMGWRASLHRLFGGPAPFRNYTGLFADRAGAIDFARTDPARIRERFADGLEKRIAASRMPDPARWLEDLQPLRQWIEAIRARGGDVIVYHSPGGGLPVRTEERLLPRARYWDRLAATMPGHFLNALDEPALMRFPLPDDSHHDRRDRAAYTDALADVLVRHGWLER
jgi:hypothetical protein